MSPCHLVILSILTLALTGTQAQADGGALRLWEQAGGYRVAVFTSPTPFRAGPVDISVLVQDGQSGEPVPEAKVTVTIDRASHPATTAAATNKLFHSAKFELPAGGRWEVAIAIEGPFGPATVRFELEAAGPPPRWRELGPWIAWPGVVVALFAVHQVLIRRRGRTLAV